MSTTRNRGKQSNDDKYFSSKWYNIFTLAVDDLSYLFTRGYAEKSALQVVGNRYKLNKRQRNAILRMSCASQNIAQRKTKECKPYELENKNIELDGFNLLILVENALSGAYVFKGRDGLYRDISSVHGSYKRVLKTEKAILLIGETLKGLKVESVKWYFDQPVSNSGRLKTKLLELSSNSDFNWDVELVFDPDKVLAKGSNVVISSDGWILDNAERWFNLGALLIENHITAANVIAS